VLAANICMLYTTGMAKLSEGDAVVVTAREQSAADVKSGLYYAHYGNLTGTILKIYGEEASVLVDKDVLPTEIAKRHTENEKAMRQRWLDGLSEEARNKLTASEKAFGLNYAVLVSLSDLTRGKKRDDASVKRPSEADLSEAEARFLAERAAKN
jgi:hypothetical protein